MNKRTPPLLLLVLLPLLAGQTKPVDDIHMVTPVVDQPHAMVTVPGAFWNEKMAGWIEAGLCGRPSDFLHETVISVTTTRTLLEDSLRKAGFHDADAWVSSVQDFPRIRGDRLMVVVSFTRPNADGSPGMREDTYSLDELMAFQGWGTAAGPYGFMFKGDPDRNRPRPPASPATAPLSPVGNQLLPGTPAGTEPESDASKILHDDPQIALVFKGIQSASQSFADHPLAYDDWVYPMMNFERNYAVLPGKVYDSNGDIALQVTFRKVSEEELLRESARLWHDAGWQAAIVAQIPVAQQIDRDKAAYRVLFGQLANQSPLPAATAPPDPLAPQRDRHFRVLTADIEKGYATLDAAWAAYAADHAVFPRDDPKFLKLLQETAAQWRAHLALKQTAAEQRAIAAAAAEAVSQLAPAPTDTEAIKEQRQVLLGGQLAANSRAILADNQQTRERWLTEQAHVDPKNDPRVDWLREITLEVELTNARQELGLAGVAFGDALKAAGAAGRGGNAALQQRYARASVMARLAELKLDHAHVSFEIGKREGFDNDPELPGLKARQKQLASDIAQLEAGLPAATMPK